MNEDSPIFLKLTNIKWEQFIKNNKVLPKELEIQWNDKNWDYNQILNWLRNQFEVKVNSLDIKELKNKKGSGWSCC